MQAQRLSQTSFGRPILRPAAPIPRKMEGAKRTPRMISTAAHWPTSHHLQLVLALILCVCVIDCSLICHDLELTPVKDGILGTSRNIALLTRPSGGGARDVEVFGVDGLATPLPAPPALRAPSGRDMEYFDDLPEAVIGTRVGTIRLAARDVEVFGEYGLDEPLPAPPPAPRHLSCRDMEYFYDAPPPPKSFGARDAEVFGVDGLAEPLPAPPQQIGRLSSRDAENYFDDGMPVFEKAAPSARVPAPARLGPRDVEVFGACGLSMPLPIPAHAARVPSGRDMEYFD
jgi:hypothetical protein